MLSTLCARLRAAATFVAGRVKAGFRQATRPLPLVAGLALDLTRSRKELLAENTLLRQQLIVASRKVKRPAFRSGERGLLLLLAGLVPRWRDAVLLVKPDTILRWHRQGFRLLWRCKSRRSGKPRPRLSPDVIELIRRMARSNATWGAERIRGELLKLGIRVAKRTIQKYLRAVRPPAPPRGQSWHTFLHNHSVWACDLLQTYDIWFRPIFAFFIYVGSARREALDHIIILGERHFRSVLLEYVRYFNTMRPHQGLGQRIPISTPQRICADASKVAAMPVLGGLHHDYRAAA